MTGYTDSANFPTQDQYQTDLTGRDVFVTMLDTSQTGAASLLYSTYLGGSGTDVGTGIALDANGYIYVTGHASADFPTLNPYQTDQANADAFVTKLDPTQTGNASLLFSTYLGGSGSDYGIGIAADANGYAYVTGDQDSTDFPTKNPYQTDQAGTDAFVTKLDTTKSGAACLVYSTYLGGSAGDYGYGIATDGSGNAFAIGYTVSSDFPTLGPYQTDQADRDVFVTRLDTKKTGTSSLVYSTYLGGSGEDYGMRIAADGYGRAYVVGFTYSTDFPTLHPYQTDPGDAGIDAFVAKIDTAQTGVAGLLYSTYLGGSGIDYGYGIAADSGGIVSVTGSTTSTNYPTVNAYQAEPGDANYDAFVTKIDPTQNGAASVIFSTYLGGSSRDEGQGIAMDSTGMIYVAGSTDSTGFPTLNPYQTDQSVRDAFVTKIYESGLSATLTLTSPNGGEIWGWASHTLTWTSTGLIANVKLEYSTNNGADWTTIVASTPNDGSQAWIVPSVDTIQALVRVSDASNAAVVDGSNAVFTIRSDVTEPNENSASAAALPLGTTENLVYEARGGAGEADWYKFFVPPAEAGKDLRVNVRVTSTYPDPIPAGWTSDLDFELLDGAMALRGTAQSGSDNETLYIASAASGWYYVYVGYSTTEYADSTGYARYSVTVETGTSFGLGYLSGRVVDVSGNGIAQVFLRLAHNPANMALSFPIMTSGADGYFNIAYLPGELHPSGLGIARRPDGRHAESGSRQRDRGILQR